METGLRISKPRVSNAKEFGKNSGAFRKNFHWRSEFGLVKVQWAISSFLSLLLLHVGLNNWFKEECRAGEVL